jgi:hypothetical protein
MKQALWTTVFPLSTRALVLFLMWPWRVLFLSLPYVYFLLSWSSCPFRDQAGWNSVTQFSITRVEVLILLSESKVWKTLSPLVLFIFIFTKNVQTLHFNMLLVMTPDGGSPNSVTPARPSCDTRACATLTRDWKINTFITYYTSA